MNYFLCRKPFYSGCETGWYKLGQACFMFYFQSSGVAVWPEPMSQAEERNRHGQ